jgi:hypothetical protein
MSTALAKALAMLAIAMASMLGWSALAAPVTGDQNSGSLEQDYANLCANRPAPETETCAALKRALMAKLSGGTSNSSVAATHQGSPATRDLLSPNQLRTHWGFLVDSIGKRYFTTTPGLASGIEEYRWNVPGESIVISSQSATKSAEVKADGDCVPTTFHLAVNRQTEKLEAWTEGPCHRPDRRPVTVEADGTLVDNHPNGKYRTRTWRNADGSLTRVTEELKRNGTWKPIAYGTRISREMTPQFMAELRGGGSSGGSGLTGALAMATGAALAGGNAEQVMGMAMKGAELTTDNEMSRNVLAGQGDAMIAEGTQRANESNGSRGSRTSNTSPATSAAAGVAGATLPAAPGNDSLTPAFVVCNLYGQYDSGKNWQFYVSRIGEIQTGTGEIWPDSPSDPIARSWGNHLRQAGADVDAFASGVNPDFPVCHGFQSESEAAQAREGWIRDVHNSSVHYTVHEESWQPSGVNQ